jgi:four helix bundle protein
MSDERDWRWLMGYESQGKSGTGGVLERTKQFALQIIRLYSSLPKTTEAQVIGKQLLRSGTSVGAHIREGKRSRSDAEMISKTEGALQEPEETQYWIELLVDANIIRSEQLPGLLTEANEITAILVTSVKTLKARKNK